MMPRHVGVPPGGTLQRDAGTGHSKAAGAGRIAILRPGGHHRPIGIEGAHSGRCSSVRNVETPTGIRPGRAGGPTVRKADSPGGNRMAKKRMLAAERQRETGK